MSGAHSRIGASSMERWSQCPGSVRLCATVPNLSSSYAEEGTRAHDIAAALLLKQKPKEELHPELMSFVWDYVSFIHYLLALQKPNPNNLFLVEQRLDLSSLHPNLFGTADAILYDANLKTLQCVDLKYGKGKYVDVENNPQLLYYALGALIQTKVPCEEVEVIIVQPRCPDMNGETIRRWKFKSVEILDFAADLVMYAKRTDEPDAPLVPGGHCQFCSAAAICPALHNKAQEMARIEFSTPDSYDAKKLGEILHWIPALESWIKSVKSFANAESRQGRTPPGWKLVAGRNSRFWAENPEIVETKLLLEFGLNYDQVYKKEMHSPAAIEKLLEKKDQKLLEALVIKKSSTISLVPETDKREALKLDAKSEFTEIGD